MAWTRKVRKGAKPKRPRRRGTLNAEGRQQHLELFHHRHHGKELHGKPAMARMWNSNSLWNPPRD